MVFSHMREIDTFRKSLNVAVIPAITTDGLLEICSRIGGNIALDLKEIPNKALKITMKSRSDMLNSSKRTSPGEYFIQNRSGRNWSYCVRLANL